MEKKSTTVRMDTDLARWYKKRMRELKKQSKKKVKKELIKKLRKRKK